MFSNIKYSLDDLVYMMGRLRDPQTGCPWDLEQSPQSIINYSIEEVYELAEVIERDTLDYSAYKDELGDVLLQVVFLSQFAAEKGEFELHDVITHLCEKMIRRHPHVFPNGELRQSIARAQTDEPDDGKTLDKSATQQNESLSSGQVTEQWDAIKRKERGVKEAEQGMFDSIPLQLPALVRAHKVQKKAAKIGLDWASAQGALDKVLEECRELQELLPQHLPDTIGASKETGDDSRLAVRQESVAQNSADTFGAIDEELGDLLFSVVNVVRKLGRNPEQILRVATQKFAQRAEFVDEKLHSQSTAHSGVSSPQEIDAYWRAAKDAGL